MYFFASFGSKYTLRVLIAYTGMVKGQQILMLSNTQGLMFVSTVYFLIMVPP